jgi:P27 family predicted phage terminase small subunit
MGARGPAPHIPAGSAARSAPGVPPAPNHLSPNAADEYDRVALLLNDSLQQHDAAVLAAYAAAVEEVATFTEQLRTEGHILKSATGGRYLHPAHAARASAHKLLLATATQLGLSPAARARLGAVNTPAALPVGPESFNATYGTAA